MPRTWTPLLAADLADGAILFDGVCLLCSRWVRFVAARDGGRFRFVPAQSAPGRHLARRLGIDAAALEADAVVLSGLARFKFDAALAVLGTLPERRAARAGAVAPRAVRDWG